MRPRDEDNNLLPPPHLRLSETPALQERALFAMATDPRGCALTVKRKLSLADKAIDHVVDGDAVPKWVHARDPDFPNNHFLLDLWRLAVDAIRKEWRAIA